MPEQAAHGVIVLAAGASQRLGRSKQLVQHHGEALVRRATRLAQQTRPRATIVVLGADADAVFAAVADFDVQRVDCTDWRSGMGASLRAGIAVLPTSCAGALVVLCDQPALDAAHLDRLVSAWRTEPGFAAASFYASRLGVPALLPRSWFTDLHDNNVDRGARALLAERSDQVIPIANEALAIDIDRAEDLGVIDS